MAKRSQTRSEDEYRVLFKQFRISTACHWAFGDYLLRDYDELVRDTNKRREQIHKYLEKIEMYFNSEFYSFNTRPDLLFKRYCHVCCIISIADILGFTQTNLGDK